MQFERLFNPGGIAIVGAGTNPASAGSQTLHALQRFKYPGAIYPVNPKYPTLAGLDCYKSLADIKGDCDVAVIAVGAAHVPGVIDECGKAKIPYAVVLGGGFRETGEEGAKIEAAMLAAARRHGIRVIGPNCNGLVNWHQNSITAAGSLVRPPDLFAGPVSAVLQSGAFGRTLVTRLALAGIGFRYVVTSGNETDISACDLIDAFIDDPETKVILAHLEGVRDGRGFMRAARKALAAGKPLVVYKAGNSAAGRKAAASHTANLTSAYDIYRAAFAQCGVIEVNEMDQAADLVNCLIAGRLPKGRNVVLMGGSGGSATVFCDAADAAGLHLAPISPDTLKVLKETLPAISSLGNPIDYTAGHPTANEVEPFLRAFDAVFADPNVHQVGFMLATIVGDILKRAADVITRAAAKSDKPVFVFEAIPDELAGEGLQIFKNAKVPVLWSPKRIAEIMGMLATYSEAVASGASKEPTGELNKRPGEQSRSLDEKASKDFVAAGGVPVTRDMILPIGFDKAALTDFNYPVVVKIVSPDIMHKTDVGAVRLGIQNAEQLVEAAAQIVKNAKAAVPNAKLAGIMVSEMITDTVEMIVGVVNDEAFGPVVALGAGGIYTEVLKDVTYRIAPFGLYDAKRMIDELKMRPILDGVRGHAPYDVDALANVLVKVSELAWESRDKLKELDINPVLVRVKGLGVVAADAAVTLG